MQSNGKFSQIFTQISEAFSSVGCKTQSLELVDVNYMSQEEFMLKIQQLSIEIPLLKTIVNNQNLFTLFPSPQLIYSIVDQILIGDQTQEEIGFGANAQVFVNTFQNENFAVKTMKKINISMLEFYIQECINQDILMKINKDYILNLKGQAYISIKNSQASIYIPLELAEYSLFDYIQNNEITQEIYQYFYNLLIDMLILLHSNNYAHRDIKPQNILFIKGQGWKLADFGESIKYEKRQSLFRIQGTIAFLPQEIRKQVHKHKEVFQDLYKNDIYAVICTLVMIRNSQFKSKELINYMDTEYLSQDLQQLYQTQFSDNPFEQLLSLKGQKFELNIEVFKPNQKQFNFQMHLSIEDALLIHYQSRNFIDENFINIIDTELRRLQEDQKLDEYQKLILYITLLFPFQIHQFRNFNQKLLNHKQITQKRLFFLDNELFKYIYLEQFVNQYEYINDILNKEIKKQNLFVILKLIGDFIRIENLEQAKYLLQIVGMIMLDQTNFDSELFFFYDLFYCKLHGKSLSFEFNIQDNFLNGLIQKDIYHNENSFDLDFYLNQCKFLNNQVNLIQLFEPLYTFALDQQTLKFVFRHIIQVLGLSELSILEDQFILATLIKQQLIKAGFLSYKYLILNIIKAIVKLFLNYDLFEGLLDLLHYFIHFMKFLDRLIYHQIILMIQNLILKLNFSIYHIKEDFNTQFVKIISKQTGLLQIRNIQLLMMIDLNKIQFNMIQDQQKTELYPINLDNQYILQNVLNIIALNTQIIYKYKPLFLTIKQYSQFLGYVQSQNQIYLRILVLLVCKFLYRDGSNTKNRDIIKGLFDPILLAYYIQCKQYNRINELFNSHNTKEDLKPFQQQQVENLVDIVLIKQNSLNRINSNYIFLYIEQLLRFVLNQKFRQLFNFKQHLYAGSISKSIQRRLNINKICLKEQYLGVK